MNQEVKEKWVAALRSGEYKQTKQTLHDKNGFCCLGVLCDLYLKENDLDWQEHNYDPKVLVCFDREDTLPDEVADWADIPTNPYVNVPGYLECVALAALNDGSDYETPITRDIKPRDFNQIADLIETAEEFY